MKLTNSWMYKLSLIASLVFAFAAMIAAIKEDIDGATSLLVCATFIKLCGIELKINNK